MSRSCWFKKSQFWDTKQISKLFNLDKEIQRIQNFRPPFSIKNNGLKFYLENAKIKFTFKSRISS